MAFDVVPCHDSYMATTHPTVTPGTRYHEGRAVHLAATTTHAACGRRLLGVIDTEAPLSCLGCGA